MPEETSLRIERLTFPILLEFRSCHNNQDNVFLIIDGVKYLINKTELINAINAIEHEENPS